MDAELKQYLDGLGQRIDNLGERTDAQFRLVREENAAAHEETRSVLRGEMAEMTGTLRGEMAGMSTALRGEIDEKLSNAVSTLRGEMAAENAETRRHFDQRMAAEHAETRRHFDITVERWETRFDLLAESIQLVDQKLDRNVVEIREEIKFTRPTRTRRAKR